MKQSKWTSKRIRKELDRYSSDKCWTIFKDHSDALLLKCQDDFCVCKGSVVAPCDDDFLNGPSFVQDSRRVAEKFGHIKNGSMSIRIKFSTMNQAARFVLGRMSARSRDWKPSTLTR